MNPVLSIVIAIALGIPVCILVVLLAETWAPRLLERLILRKQGQIGDTASPEAAAEVEAPIGARWERTAERLASAMEASLQEVFMTAFEQERRLRHEPLRIDDLGRFEKDALRTHLMEAGMLAHAVPPSVLKEATREVEAYFDMVEKAVGLARMSKGELEISLSLQFMGEKRLAKSDKPRARYVGVYKRRSPEREAAWKYA